MYESGEELLKADIESIEFIVNSTQYLCNKHSRPLKNTVIYQAERGRVMWTI